MKRIIKTNEITLKEIKEIIKQGESAPFEQKVTAAVLLDGIVGSLKSLKDSLVDQIEETGFESIKKDFEDRGLVPYWYDKDKLAIQIGDKFEVTISSGVKTEFSVDSKLKEVDSLVPDKYKKVVTSYDKKVLEEAYDDGTLEPLLKPYINKSSKEVTKLTKKKI